MLADEVKHDDILANLVRRQSAFERHLIPWINLRRSLDDAVVVDIGCGTGSSTAALARSSKSVRGYEIELGPTAVAADRLEALKLGNASVTSVTPDETITRLKTEFPGGVDVIALIAVLEHMTELERVNFLPEIWSYMRPGNVLVVAELPNRLTYNDDHTAQIPFFHMLPQQIKTRYVDRSPRKDFVDSIKQLAKGPRDELEVALCRWGIGLSFQDFEIGFGVDRLEQVMLADGYEHHTINWWPPTVEERVLMSYFIEKPINKPLGFCRSVLNFMFVKPYPGADIPSMLKHDAGYLRNLFDGSMYHKDGLNRMLSIGTTGTQVSSQAKR